MSLFQTQTASIRPSSATADGGRFPSSPSCPSIPRKETRCAWHCAAESNGAVHPRRWVPAPIRRGTPLAEKISLADSPEPASAPRRSRTERPKPRKRRDGRLGRFRLVRRLRLDDTVVALRPDYGLRG